MPLLTDLLGSQPLVVTVAGQALPLGSTGTVTISHGRDRPENQPDAASCQIVLYADALGSTLPAVGDPLTVQLGTTAAAYLGLPTTGTGANVAQGKPATCSLTVSSGSLAAVTDGVTTGTGAATGAGNAYMQVDLGAAQSLDTIKVWHYHADGRTYYGTKVQVSADGVSWFTVFDSATAGTYPETASGRIHTFTARSVRYIRDYSNGSTANTGNHWVEIQASLVGTTAEWAAARSRFVGTISDLRAAPAAAGLSGPGILTITATGPLARLGRLIVGDVPWPAELDGARAAKILAAAQAATGNAFTLGTIDPGTVTVLGRDVDAQPALDLLHELADHAGAVIVGRRDGAIEWHDAEHRRNVVQNALELTADHVLRDAVWEQGLSGMVNDLSLSYGPEGIDGQPRVRAEDTASVSAHGRIAAQLSTQLVDATAATARLNDLLGRRSRPRWRLEQLAVDVLRSVPAAVAAQLAQLELGRLLLVTGFPESGPFVTARLFVEGWTETFAGSSGWSMQLAVSEYALSGPAPRWADVPPSWTWAGTPADVTWLSAAGWYPGEALAGRWLDVPADASWAELPNTTTWATADVLWAD